LNWKGKTVLVTGAGGFIGSHLAESLVELGAKVRALVHYNALNTWGWLEQSAYAGEMEVIAGDICDRDCVRRAMEKTETVFHLAALIAIPYSYDAPESYVRTNIQGTLNILQAAREVGIAKLVHTSTSEVYGTARYVPIDEAHPLQGQSPYSATKIGADKLAEAFYCSFGIPVVTVRPFNTFGPRQSARAVIPTIIVQALSGQKVHLGNLLPTRDMNYVANTVEGFLLAAGAPNAIGQAINVGSGREIAIGGLVALIGELMGREIQIESQSGRLRPENSEVDRLMADSRKARELLGWKPAITLEDGLKRSIEWFAANIEKYRPHRYTI